MPESAKSINELMIHLRTNCHLKINGNEDKKLLA